MMRKKLGMRGVGAEAVLHFANRNAIRGGKNATRSHFANRPATGRHLEQACASLQDAAVELESVLFSLSGSTEQADLHEAIGSIMETLQLIAATQARLEPSAAAE
ncbi:hypothetical protein D3877_18090 [Azospirillum cavernae]|uniref:Uncharacterized protein n=1 Tax=Azospirillum cavernae TaxID=2320860 RepID=A0A418VY00_9PROT|nr:hypothetical protein [Azospirillum cavernae]RJF81995.1 hypothetical protein D3877_18090 [Azospirillum cavernae]